MNRCEVICLDADIVWRFNLLRDLPVFPHDATNSSILVAGNCAYVGTGNGVYDGKMVLPNAASLVALDNWTGRLLARDDGRQQYALRHLAEPSLRCPRSG